MARASRPARPFLVCLFSLMTLLWSGVALAGSQDLAVVALHQKNRAKNQVSTCPDGVGANEDPVTTKTPCTSFSVDNAPVAVGRDVYLVVARGNAAAGIAGVSCGIAYTFNVAVWGWQLCADLEFKNGGWPQSGGGTRITWGSAANCQRTTVGIEGVHAVAGAFYVYAYDDGDLNVTPNNNVPTPEFKVADCSASESSLLIGGGEIGFGNETGFNPCQLPPVPVEDTTWGGVKSRER